MTAQVIDPEPVPLVRDLAGRLMVSGTRVSLDILVAAFKRGESPEAIHDDYDTVPLADVYAICSCYLRHHGEIETYLAEQVREGAEIQARMEEMFRRPRGYAPSSSAGRTRERSIRHRPSPNFAWACVGSLATSTSCASRTWDCGRSMTRPAWRGPPTPGIFVLPTMMPIGAAIDDLALIVQANDPGGWVGRVVYFPLLQEFGNESVSGQPFSSAAR